jgi:hypothetical protein
MSLLRFNFLCILIFLSSEIIAQVYLDYAKIHINLNPIGGYNLGQFKNGDYIVIDNYISNQSDLNPDDTKSNNVYSSFLSSGYYLAKYNKEGEYINHTFIINNTGKSGQLPFAINDSFICFIGEFYDEARFYNNGSFDTIKKNGSSKYLAKYNHQLELKDVFVLPNDSLYYNDLLFNNKGELLIVGNNSGNVVFNNKGLPKTIGFNPKNKLSNTSDLFILKLNEDLEYSSHVNFGVKGEEIFNQIYCNEKNEIILSGYVSFRDKGVIMGDTFKMSDNFGYGTSPLILRFNEDLQLKDYYINELLDARTLIANPNGDFLFVCNGKLSSQSFAFYFILLDSNFNEKLRFNSNGLSGNNSTISKESGFVNKNDNYSLIINAPILFMKDTTLYLSKTGLLTLNKDSLKLVSFYELNPYLKEVFHADSNNILTTIQFNGNISLQPGVFGGPPFSIGDPLQAIKQYTAVCNYQFNCTPVTTYLEYDSQVNCADQYGMQAGRGNVHLKFKGSGAAFQWYNASDTTFKLSDQMSPLQGGQKWQGTKTNYLKYELGTNKFLKNLFVAKVGGSCTVPYWSDTATQIIWGAPQMLGQVAGKIVTEGGSDSIIAILNDPNYPIDSVEFQWFRGATALIDGLRFKGARTPKLYINNIKDYDQGIFSCYATRIHCRDFNAILASSTIINVKTTNLNIVENSSIQISPNPTNQFLNINISEYISIANIRIFDVLGKEYSFTMKDTQLDVSLLPSGVYFLQVKSDNQIITTKFVKN